MDHVSTEGMEVRTLQSRNTAVSDFIREQLSSIPADKGLALKELAHAIADKFAIKTTQCYVRINNVLKSKKTSASFTKLQKDGNVYISPIAVEADEAAEVEAE